MLIIALVFIIPTCGSLLYLLTRSNLGGQQKFVTLMIALSIAVPVGGAVFLVFAFAGIILFWESEISEILFAVVWIFVPVSVAGNSAFTLTTAVVDNREARKAEEAGVKPLRWSDIRLLALLLGLALTISIVLAPMYLFSWFSHFSSFS